MMKTIRCIGAICLLCALSACGSKEPEISPSEVVESYLTAMRTQQSEEMAKYSISGVEEDFTLTDYEVEALGMDVSSAQAFLKKILNFQYELDGESIYLSEENATVTIKLTTYDVNTVVTQAVENNKDKFKEISASKQSDEEKQKQISDIIIADFDKAQRSIEKSITLQLKLIDSEWKVKDVDEKFYNTLLNIE